MPVQFTSTLGFRRIRTPLTPFGAWAPEHDPDSASSTPDYDEWGWDDWWKASDWIRWHRALKAAYGPDEANRRFIDAWDRQTNFAGPIDARTFNSDFKAYARENGFYQALFSGSGALARPVAAGVSVVDAASGAVEDVAAAVSTTGSFARYLLPVAAVVMGFLYLQSVTPRRR